MAPSALPSWALADCPGLLLGRDVWVDGRWRDRERKSGIFWVGWRVWYWCNKPKKTCKMQQIKPRRLICLIPSRMITCFCHGRSADPFAPCHTMCALTLWHHLTPVRSRRRWRLGLRTIPVNVVKDIPYLQPLSVAIIKLLCQIQRHQYHDNAVLDEHICILGGFSETFIDHNCSTLLEIEGTQPGSAGTGVYSSLKTSSFTWLDVWSRCNSSLECDSRSLTSLSGYFWRWQEGVCGAVFGGLLISHVDRSVLHLQAAVTSSSLSSVSLLLN